MYFSIPNGWGMAGGFESLLLNTCYGSQVSGRTVVGIIGGGGTRGAFTAGLAWGLQDLGLHHGFSGLLLSSTGVGSGVCMASGQTRLAAEAYQRICSRSSFIRLHRRGSVDVGSVVRAMEGKSYGGRYRLDVDAMRAAPMEIYVLVATLSGSVECLNIKEVSDPFDLIHASMALPGWLYGKLVEIDGVKYCDGAILEPLAIEEAKLIFDPTDIIWFPNQTVPMPRDLARLPTRWQRFKMLPTQLLEYALFQLALKDHAPRFQTLAKQAKKRLQRRVESAIYDPDVHFAILPTTCDEPMSPFVKDPLVLEDAVISARLAIKRAFKKFQEDLKNLWPLNDIAHWTEEDHEEFVQRHLKLLRRKASP